MAWDWSEPREKKRGPRKGAKYAPRKRRADLGAAVAPPMSSLEKVRRHREKKKQKRIENIAILDFETDPFDASEELKIAPFLAVLYGQQFEPVVIWEEDEDRFIEKVIAAIEALPEKYTIYAHNGGRFDYLFLIKRLRGVVSFKGRGIMSATVGNHELRDSFHIIPERLANWQKDKFDYSLLKKGTRAGHRKQIIDYCIADCRYLLEIVTQFVEGFGFKLTIGQAAMTELRKFYEVPKLYDGFDNYLRQWFYGGRVECLKGRGDFVGAYKLYDVNSLYPYVMAHFAHPIGSENQYQIRYGEPGPDTVFIELECKNNGALIGKSDDGETTAKIKEGRFRTTIWEYNVAVKYNLISDIQIIICVDCPTRSDFSKFVIPLYENRLHTKSTLDRMKKDGLENTAAFMDIKKDDIFYKLLLNNAYGKFAINPRNFVENYLTDPDELPPVSWFKSLKRIESEKERVLYEHPAFENEQYWIWQKPNPGAHFNNVGVAASITGAARAVLLEALQHAVEPIYCDTDSIICKELPNVPISKTDLGAWDLEDEFTRVIVNGKKLYSTWHSKEKRRSPEQLADGLDPRYTVKSKGTARITWDEMELLLGGKSIKKRNRAPTLTRYSEQYYVTRTIRATAPIRLEA